MSQPTKGTAKARDPPPTLFLHPSPAASHVSLPGILAPGVPAANAPSPLGNLAQPQAVPSLSRSGSLRGARDGGGITSPIEARRSAHAGHPHALRTTTTANAPGGLNLSLNFPPQLQRNVSTRATDRTDALWAEMQATLEEVELSASGGTRVFGPDHDRKLGDLRAAQIALAQAWARSEADETIETMGGLGEARNAKSQANPGDAGAEGAAKAETDPAAKSTAGTASARPGSSGLGVGGQDRFGAKLEEETQVDILLARKRREANDRYFQRVNQGVLDVVAKLEDVAVAMRAVEQESKDIWGETESVPGSAKT